MSYESNLSKRLDMSDRIEWPYGMMPRTPFSLSRGKVLSLISMASTYGILETEDERAAWQAKRLARMIDGMRWEPNDLGEVI